MKTDSVRVLLALVVAIALGLLIAASNDARLVGLADQLVPIGTLWVNAIRMTVIPLVVSLLVTGVASTTDVAAIGRLGARTVIVFLLLPAGMAVVMMPIIAAVFAWLPPAASRPPLPAGRERGGEPGRCQRGADACGVVDLADSVESGCGGG